MWTDLWCASTLKWDDKTYINCSGSFVRIMLSFLVLAIKKPFVHVEDMFFSFLLRADI